MSDGVTGYPLRECRERAEELTARNADLCRLLESLTPGGSEFHGDPERCARHVRERFAAREEAIRRFKGERDELRAQLDHCAEELQLARAERDQWKRAAETLLTGNR